MIARCYKYIRWLSLDITAGAIFVFMFLSRELGVSYFRNEWLLLGISVWLIYTLDHLLDVLKATVATERRSFHQQHQRVLWTIVIVVLTASMFFAFSLSSEMLVGGCILGGLAILYLLLSQLLQGTKEFFGALIYSSGILLVAFVRGHIEQVVPLVLLLFLLAYLNLVIFSLLERDQDQKEGFNSFAAHFGARRSTIFIWVIAALLILGTGGLYISGYPVSMVLFFLIATLVHMLLFWIKWFHSDERYRIIGDLTFVLPGLLLILS